MMKALQPTIGLAPMEGVTDLPFRLWIALASQPDFCWTPFLRVTDTFPGKALPEDFIPEIQYPGTVAYNLVPQIMGNALGPAASTAELILKAGAEWVDLNCGCPSPRVVGHGAGSSMLAEPHYLRGFVRSLTAAVGSRKLSIKMRTGYNDASEFHTILSALDDAPLRQLTVHGRTRVDRYDGHARWDLIHEGALSLPFPVVGSGDIVSKTSLTSHQIKAPTVQTMIVGRGAIRNPWIFQELRSGEAIILSRETVRAALAVAGLLVLLGAGESPVLRQRLREGFFLRHCGTDAGAWRDLYERLCLATFGEMILPESLPLHRGLLGRVKMIWHSWRSSLPEPLFAPLLMRSGTFGELDAGIGLILNELPEQFVCGHQTNYDWLYTSSKKNPRDSRIEDIQPPRHAQIEDIQPPRHAQIEDIQPPRHAQIEDRRASPQSP